MSRLIRALLVVVMVILLVPRAPGPAVAQGPASGIRLHLIDQPVWHGPDDPLGLTLRVTNSGSGTLRGFHLTVGVGDLIRSRSALHESFKGAPSFSQFVKDLSRQRLLPGKSTVVRVSDQVMDNLTSLTPEGDPGVYPLTISLFGPRTVLPLDTLTSHLLFFPEAAENPLSLVTVVPINEIPSRDPQGLFVETGPRSPLAEGLSDDGWLSTQLDALIASTAERESDTLSPRRTGKGKQAEKKRPEPPEPLHVAVAPTPRFLEEVADMADGYRRVTASGIDRVGDESPPARDAADYIARLRSLLRSPRVQGIPSPYSFPDLPALGVNLPLDDTSAQFAEGKRVTEEVLGRQFDPAWMFPPAGRLDLSTLERLQSINVAANSFFSADSVASIADPAVAGCPEPTLTFACPVEISTLADRTRGFIFDAELQLRLVEMARASKDRAVMQRVFAETAQIHAEQPGVANRLIAAQVPPGWSPSGRLADEFFTGLSEAPWLRTETPREGLQGAEAIARDALPLIAPLPDQPAEDYFSAIETATGTVESFRHFISTSDQIPRLLDRLGLLRRNLLAAQSRAWWSDEFVTEGKSYATRSQQSAESDMQRVSIVSTAEVTLTSRKGQIPFSLVNENDFPVIVELSLGSLKLDVADQDLTQELPPGTSRLTVEATAQSSGTFPLDVQLTTTDGFVISRKSILIRSTEFNRVALGITLGALAFLISFYLWRGVRKRAHHGGHDAGPAEA